MKQIIKATLMLPLLGLLSCGKKSETTQPIRKDVTEMVFASGILEADGSYQLTAKTDGYLIQMDVEEGDVVARNATVAIIDNKENQYNATSASELYTIAESNTRNNAPAITQSYNNMIAARYKMDTDSVQYKRYQVLLEQDAIAVAEYDNQLQQYRTSKASYISAKENFKLAEQQARQQLISARTTMGVSNSQTADNRISAVVGGKVYKKHKKTGDFVKKGDVVLTIGNADRLYALVNIDESNIRKIAIGQEAIISLNTDKSKTYKATVEHIYPAFDEASQSFQCKLFFTDSLTFKVVGTQLQSNIIIGTRKNALLIPRNYLDFDGTVRLKKGDKKQRITTGFISKDWVAVTAGIGQEAVLITDNVSKTKTSELGAQMR